MSANVVDFPNTSLADVPAGLRRVADLIESGELGLVGCCAVAVLANQFHLWSFGTDSSGPSTCIVLMAGVQTLADPIARYGKDGK